MVLDGMNDQDLQACGVLGTERGVSLGDLDRIIDRQW